jgi:hypothetical protein
MSSKRLLFVVSALSLAMACSSGTGSSPGGPNGSSSGSGGQGSSTGSSGGGSSGGTGDGGTGSGGSSGAAPEGGTGPADGGGVADSGSGSGGDGGSADGGSAVVPVQVANSNKYRFTFGDVVFEVDQDKGARVDTLTVGGTNIVEPPVTDPTQWGSTFWTSPRSDWKPMTWPPPASIDINAYTGGPSGTHLVVASSVDPTMGISVDKDYSVDGASGWIHIAYTIHVTSAFKCAPWEDTRVPRGGLAFFPAGSLLMAGPLTLTTVSGIVWFDDTSMSATSTNGSKAIAAGTGGWSAYAVGGVLFLKKFTNTPASAFAPSEGEIDIYPGMGFLEVEVEGPYTSIPANGSLPWSIAWRAVKIPSSVTVAAGSSTLVDFAKQQAAM